MWAEFNGPRIQSNQWTLRTQGTSGGSIPDLSPKKYVRDFRTDFNPLNAELNPICYLLALLGAHHFLHVSRIRVKSLTLRLLMSYIYDISNLRLIRAPTVVRASRLSFIAQVILGLTFISPCIVIIFQYINPNKVHMLQSLFYLTIALHVSGVTVTHIQEHKTTVTLYFECR